MRARRAVVGLLASVVLAACAEEAEPPPQREALMTPAVTEVVIEVDYQPGAEPYALDNPVPFDPLRGRAFGDPWGLTEANLEALFSAAPKTLVIPHGLDEMEAIDDFGDGDDEYGISEILAISERHRQEISSWGRRAFHVLFLDGFYYDDEDGRSETVLGVSLGDTGVVAMFKPAIAGNVFEGFVEQTTIVHELGHAAGLVNLGIAPQSDHHDAEHGAHCTNERCVMYWANEGVGGMKQFVKDFVKDGDAVVFDDACLEDAHAAAGR